MKREILQKKRKETFEQLEGEKEIEKPTIMEDEEQEQHQQFKEMVEKSPP